MKKKYIVHIEQTRHTDIEVEAETYTEAENLAMDEAYARGDDCWGCYESNCWDATED